MNATERMEAIATEYSFDLTHARRNGDRVVVAVLEQVIQARIEVADVRAALAQHETKDGRLIRSGAASLVGIGLCTLTATWPALEARLESLLAIDIPTPPLALLTAMKSVGALAILIGIAWAVWPAAVHLLLRLK